MLEQGTHHYLVRHIAVQLVPPLDESNNRAFPRS